MSDQDVICYTIYRDQPDCPGMVTPALPPGDYNKVILADAFIKLKETCAQQAGEIERLHVAVETEDEAYETAARLCDERAEELRDWNKINMSKWASDQAKAFEDMAVEIRDYKSNVTENRPSFNSKTTPSS